MIVDVHCHYVPAPLLEAFELSSEVADLSAVLAMMNRFGIDKTVLIFPGGHDPKIDGGWREACRIYNESLFAVMRSQGDRFIGAALLPMDRSDHLMTELQRVRGLGIRILSLLSSYHGEHLDHERFYPVYEFAQKYQMPVYVHPQSYMELPSDFTDDMLVASAISPIFDMAICVTKMITAGVFLRYEDVKFIFGHAGPLMALLQKDLDEDYVNFRKTSKIKDILMRPSAYLKNVYWETGGNTSLHGIRALTEMVSPQRVFFGTNYPSGYKVQEMMDALRLAVPEQGFREMMLGENFYAVMNL
jgi:predicted TIM-barrel fold metal-dependent hydrolase